VKFQNAKLINQFKSLIIIIFYLYQSDEQKLINLSHLVVMH